MAGVFKSLLLATEHSESDSGAEALALALARRCGLALCAVLPVAGNPEFETVAPELAARADAQAHDQAEQLQAAARALGVALAVNVRRGPEAYAEVIAEARERHADLIVIRRRGQRSLLANLLVGEMVSKVVSHAPCSLLVAPRAAALWQRRILVGIDPLHEDPGLLALAAAVAGECGLPLSVLGVMAAGQRAAAQASVDAAVRQARDWGVACDGQVLTGRPHQALVQAAALSGADLIVVGRHGGETLARAWIGGTAQKVIGLAACPVLIHVNPGPTEPSRP
jgi:hypothetical protein